MNEINPMTTQESVLAERSRKFGVAEGDEGIVRCDACPVLCRIRPGRAGACSRYANENGLLIRTDPVVLLAEAVEGLGRSTDPAAVQEQARSLVGRIATEPDIS